MPAVFTPHHHLRRRNKISSKKNSYLIDQVVWLAVFAGISVTIPQVYIIWVHKNASGVSPIAWTGYAILSVVWLIYGLAHKEKVIIFSNSVYLLLNSLVALGALLYGNSY